MCDPLALQDVPIQLGAIIGVGSSATGVIFLADDFEERRERVFVSSGGVLWRKDVGGSSSGHDQEGDHWQYSYSDDGQDMILAIDVPRSGDARMAVGAGRRAASVEAVAASGEPSGRSSTVTSRPRRSLSSSARVQALEMMEKWALGVICPDGVVLKMPNSGIG